MIGQVLLFLSGAFFSLLLTFPVLWGVKYLKIRQSIRQEGPQSHQSKSGTPTMGGLGFILTIFIFVLIFIDLELKPQFLAVLLLMLGYAGIGLVDDWLKITKQQNLGLTFWQKIIWQTSFAAIFSLFIILKNPAQGLLFSIFYFPFSIFIIVGTANAANLTDGLNGLLSGCATIAFLAFTIVANKLVLADAATFSLIIAGTTAAFLYFNFPQAKLFMGDIGSLSLGAALAGIALVIKQELLLIIIGGIFVLEALSVIIQVGSYKLFKKRIFKMAPLHHHFELMGIPEMYVVVGFWLAGLLLAVMGVWIS